mgnify:CR=1 FL=1
MNELELCNKAMESLAPLATGEDAQIAKYARAAADDIAMIVQAVELRDNAGSDEDVAISLNVSGTPDLHIRNPELFAKMAKYYDESRVPFNSATWFLTGWLGKDVRPHKK